MQQLVSFIIPTYNRSKYLGETLENILQQSYQNWECIVVDDGSTDHTEELMSFYSKKDNRIRYYKRPSEQSKGANTCRNYGFDRSNGALVNWFDSDDLLANDYLEKQIEKLQAENTDAVMCDFSIFNDNKNTASAIIQNGTSNEQLLENFISGKINPSMQGILIKRDLVKGLRYKTHLTWADDLDFLFQILITRSVKFSFLKENKVFLRRHKDSLTGNYYSFDLRKIKSELEVRKSILAYICNEDYKSGVISGALQMYFRGFKMLFLSHRWKLVREELDYLKSLTFSNRRYLLWEVKLYGFYILQRIKFKRKGLQEHLSKFEALLAKAS